MVFISHRVLAAALAQSVVFADVSVVGHNGNNNNNRDDVDVDVQRKEDAAVLEFRKDEAEKGLRRASPEVASKKDSATTVTQQIPSHEKQEPKLAVMLDEPATPAKASERTDTGVLNKKPRSVRSRNSSPDELPEVDSAAQVDFGMVAASAAEGSIESLTKMRRQIKGSAPGGKSNKGNSKSSKDTIPSFSGTAEEVTMQCAVAGADCCCSDCDDEATADFIYPICAWNGTVTVYAGSCNGDGACFIGRNKTVDFTIGPYSCNGLYACYGAYNDIGFDSCNSYAACNFMYAGRTVGDFSCNAPSACEFSSGAVGDYACNGNKACYLATAGAGSGSCNAYQACLFTSDTIGNGQCNSPQACDDPPPAFYMAPTLPPAASPSRR